ncbi:hypothetical protein [Marinomonas primoryensis]|jgi:hypothetical protein|uniref:hypothetical protein n=1 Tax=Marinomonas primoryensis TaxID=178399 RepID=UPI003704A402
MSTYLVVVFKSKPEMPIPSVNCIHDQFILQAFVDAITQRSVLAVFAPAKINGAAYSCLEFFGAEFTFFV